MNVRDGVWRIKIWLKKFTGEFEKEEEEKRIEMIEELFEKIKEVPLEKWVLVKNEPDPFKGEMRKMYEEHRRSVIYCIFDDGSTNRFLEEFKYTLCARNGKIRIAFESDGPHFDGLIIYQVYTADTEKEQFNLHLASKLKRSIFDKETFNSLRKGQDIVDRDNIESKIIDFFGDLFESLVPIEYSDFLSGQRPLPLFMPKSTLV